MKLPKFEFIQPHSLQEACSVLREHNKKAVLLAGGTALMVALRYRLSQPAVVIGLKGLTALNYVRRSGSSGLAIGSMVTLETLEKSSLVVKEYAPLAQAVQLVAIPAIRHGATLGGNLCLDTRCIYYNQSEFWRSGLKACFKLGGDICNAVEKARRCQAVCQSDLGPVLIALGAEVKIASAQGEKVIPLAEFFTGRGKRPNILKPDEILVEVRIPTPGHGATGAYEKLRVREGMDFPMAGVAVVVKRNRGGTIERAKVVLGAVGPSPTEVSEAAGLMEGHKPTEDLLQSVSREVVDRAQPVGNLAMDASYRRKMVGVLAERALRQALSVGPENRSQ
ncbi:MAG TPA: FAD binding domain-containing protein [Thermodesulfobacteriota bacterium]|nr:FAD binding domain-containing protein [Thermodesulfobacteriota bacterium]